MAQEEYAKKYNNSSSSSGGVACGSVGGGGCSSGCLVVQCPTFRKNKGIHVVLEGRREE